MSLGRGRDEYTDDKKFYLTETLLMEVPEIPGDAEEVYLDDNNIEILPTRIFLGLPNVSSQRDYSSQPIRMYVCLSVFLYM